MGKRKNKKLFYWIIGLITAISSIFAYKELAQDSSEKINKYSYETDTLAVHFLDVGNADCILLQYNENIMMIDTAEGDRTDEVLTYLTEQGIEQINIMILTHPDADHIGGAQEIIDYLGVSDYIYMTDYEKDSKIYRKLMKAIKKTGNPVIYPEVGDSFSFGPCTVEFFGPVEKIDDSNSMSLVCKLTYKETSFLFTGDCTQNEEKDILETITANELQADVLKVAHHGSKKSTTTDFLEAVKPSYGIISCDMENDYGHPHQDVLERLEQAKVLVYRTDIDGTIIANSNGETISFYTVSNN